jgi:hypothetical protein
MPRHIIGQCSISDFVELQKQALSLNTEEVVANIQASNKQKVVYMVVHHFQLCGIPFKRLLKLKQVLVWEMDDKSLAFEYKLLDPKDTETLRILRTMSPKKVG